MWRNSTSMLLAALFLATGCLEVDVSFTKWRTAVVEGDLALSMAKVTTYGELINPVEVHEPGKAARVNDLWLDRLTVEATDSRRADQVDRDELLFIVSVEVYVEPTGPDSDLPRTLVAWYESGATPPEDPRFLTFEVDDDVGLRPYVREGCRFVFDSATRVPADDVGIRVEALLAGTAPVL